MTGSPFAQALEAALRPLRFAARDDFAGLDKVKGLEASVLRAVAAAAELAVPRDVKRTLARVAEDFQQPLEGDARRNAVTEALARLEPMATGAFAESLFDRPLTVMPGVGPKRAETLATGLASVGVMRLEPERVLFVGARNGGVAGVWVADADGARCVSNCDLRTGTDWQGRFVPPPTDPTLLEAP